MPSITFGRPQVMAAIRFSKVTIWHSLVILTSTAFAVLLPLDWVFNLDGVPGVRLARWVGFLVFAADVVVSVVLLSNAPPTRSGQVVYSLHDYKRGMLTVDLLAALPLYALTGDVRFGLLGLLKLVKVGHLLGEWRRAAVRFDTWVLLGFGAYWLAIFVHWLSCGWLALEGMPADGGIGSAYFRGLYWTVTTVTSVGYGDVVPTTDVQRVYAMLAMIIGLSFFGYVVGVIARVLRSSDPGTQRFLEGVENLAHASRLGRLPESVQKRVYDYHWYVWQQQLGHDEEDFLSGLPATLRGEVSYHLKKDLLDKVSFFHETGEHFLKDIAQYLKPAVFTPGDIVFEAGDEGRTMYFIAGGCVEVLNDRGKLINQLYEGDFFGEIALFSDGVRTATVRATQYSQLYVLDRSALRHMVRKHPEVHERIQSQALERQSRDT